jgi:hypothetical protein
MQQGKYTIVFGEEGNFASDVKGVITNDDEDRLDFRVKAQRLSAR